MYLLLSSLAGCEQATASFVARRMQIEINKVEFQIHAVRDERGALGMPIDAANAEEVNFTNVRFTLYYASVDLCVCVY